MSLFLIGLALLAGGYFQYGPLVEKILGTDYNRKTPAIAMNDGVDFVPLPHWKNMLIQLLNIAGIGPVIGVISGIKFGSIVFIIIPVGCVLMGAVHDFTAGLMSIRHNGANLTELVRIYLSKFGYIAFSIFVAIALLLLVTMFINVPAKLTALLFPNQNNVFFLSVIIIFLYYIIATLFSVDKIIGRVYPLFGQVLLIGTIALFVSLLVHGFKNQGLLEESAAFRENMFTQAKNQPIIPLLFVTIACGILSGFHATQAPIVARTIKSEKEAKNTFFGMMIVEGFIAMVWAAGGMAVYNMYPNLMAENPNNVLIKITETFLNSGYSSTIVVVSVIILAITSGDTALRSLRLSLAEMLHLSQKNFLKRIFVIIPLILIVLGLLWWSNQDAKGFGILWNYSAWANQVLAAYALVLGTIYLVAHQKLYFVTMLPGLFITFVVSCYILWVSPGHGNGGPAGFGLNLVHAEIAAAFLSALVFFKAVYIGKSKIKELDIEQEKNDK